MRYQWPIRKKTLSFHSKLHQPGCCHKDKATFTTILTERGERVIVESVICQLLCCMVMMTLGSGEELVRDTLPGVWKEEGEIYMEDGEIDKEDGELELSYKNKKTFIKNHTEHFLKTEGHMPGTERTRR